MSSLDAHARELVSAQHLMDTCETLCALGEKVAGSPRRSKACDILTDALTRYGVTHDGAPLPVLHLGTRLGGAERWRPRAGRWTSRRSASPSASRRPGRRHGRRGRRRRRAAMPTMSARTSRGKIALVGKLPSPHNAVAAAKHGAHRHDLDVGRQAAPQDDHHAGVGHAGVRPGRHHPARCTSSRSAAVDGERDPRGAREGAGEGHAEHRGLRGLARGSPAGRARSRAGSPNSCWSARITARGSTARPTTSPATRACSNSPACSSSSRASCATASASRGGPAIPTAAIPARPGMPTRSGTTCTTTPSSISTSTRPGVRGATVYVPRHQMAEVVGLQRGDGRRRSPAGRR